MSLQYIIDGYNITNHPDFQRLARRASPDPRESLLNLIKTNRLCGSPRNQVDLVFDGYSGEAGESNYSWANVIYSRDISADERIRKMLEGSPNPKRIIVVSDDKEVQLGARLFGAQALAVQDFLLAKEKKASGREETVDSEISYSAKHRINEELRKIWLKE